MVKACYNLIHFGYAIYHYVLLLQLKQLKTECNVLYGGHLLCVSCTDALK